MRSGDVMTDSIRRRCAPALVLAAALLAAAASAGAQPPAGPPAPAGASPAAATAPSDLDALRERAAAFWAARVSGDRDAQWQLLEPRGRGRLTAEEYAAGRGALKYLAYKVEDATTSGPFGTVRVRILANVNILTPTARALPPQAVVVLDRWVRIGGVWYRSLDESERAEQGGPQQ
jgi:hypothetical protein